ncbi:MAG: toxin-antitoxin system HicB family antitoxin [Verrucomicrobiota bacterium]|jgi:hypothetical protein
MSNLSVNIPESLRRRVEFLALADGYSLGQFVACAIAEKIAVLDGETHVRERAERGNREKFERVLALVPDVEPHLISQQASDQMPPA